MNDSETDLKDFLIQHRNWSRWGGADELGAINLVTPKKVRQAAGLIRTGQAISLSRPLATKPDRGNPRPATHFLRTNNQWFGQKGVGAAAEYLGVDYHGLQTTHIDALCHTWDERGGWNGIDGLANSHWDGATKGGIQAWRAGISTRGVLIDVPRHRGQPSVTPDRPVTGDEIEQICRAQAIEIEPGDALLIYCGREVWEHENPAWDGPISDAATPNPGLDPSCLRPLRENDVAVLVWDMSDAWPPGPSLPWGVHSAIFAFGMAIVDNADLSELAEVCATTGTYEFFFSVTPLFLVGGTGSPVNPIAIL